MSLSPWRFEVFDSRASGISASLINEDHCSRYQTWKFHEQVFASTE
jgi:hypothetical protein